MLMEEILERILKSLSNIPQQKFMYGLFMTLMSMIGKANFRNMSRYSDFHEKTFSRWYRKCFDFRGLNVQLIQTYISRPSDQLIAVHDASYHKKSGKHTEGLGYFYSGCMGKALRGLEISGLCIVNMTQHTGYMLDAKLTTDSEDESRVQFYARHIRDNTPTLKALGIGIIALDGFYAKSTLLESLESTDLTIVSKLRKDSKLHYCYEGPRGKVGRPRKYDGRVDVDDLSRLESVNSHELEKCEVFTQKVYSTVSKKPLRIVLIRKVHQDKVGHIILFSTDTQMSAVNIIQIYKARFQIEFCFRDAKQHTGLEDCQSLKKQAIEFHINASFSALNLLKLEERIQCGHERETVISIASYKRRRYNQTFLQIIFHRLGLDETCEKLKTQYDELCRFGCIAA